ncbi:MAG: hypothetical protein KBD01_06680 [Acidobacteria bacterium]|nr:hypothetical protein [Acidobacteriota bacterium]
MRKSTICLVGVLAVAGALAAPVALAETARFIPLDVTCGPVFFPVFCAVDMSGDGNTVLFRDRISRNGVVEMIGGPAEGWDVVALSDDGSTVVGNIAVEDPVFGWVMQAGIWLGGDTWRPLGALGGSEPCGTDWSSAYDVSGDGSRVVGLSYIGPAACVDAHGFAWDEQAGMVDLGSIVPERYSRANAISADGQVIVGWSDQTTGSRAGAKWDHGAGPEWFLPEHSRVFAGEATGVSSDGRFIVGGEYSAPPATGNFGPWAEPWLWSAETGVVPLGTVKGFRGSVIDGQHYARDVSDDGSVVVGQDTLFLTGEQWAFIWTGQTGISALQDWVRARTDPATQAKICSIKRGMLPCSGWNFWNTAAISNDGKTIVGTGANPDGMFQAFMIKID